VVESAVVGYPHEIKGSGIYAYVICRNLSDDEMKTIEDEIRATVNKFIGAIAKPDKIQIVSGLPKTGRGKSCGAFSAKLEKAMPPTSATLPPARPGSCR
jgi:acetyl-CoA synthetase